jgi:hypothetical protein
VSVDASFRFGGFGSVVPRSLLWRERWDDFNQIAEWETQPSKTDCPPPSCQAFGIVIKSRHAYLSPVISHWFNLVLRFPHIDCPADSPLTHSLTNQLITTALSIGVSHITIHGRTRHQPSTAPVNHEAIKFAVECVKGQVPTVGNGDIWDLGEAATMRETGVRGVMGARGLLAK